MSLLAERRQKARKAAPTAPRPVDAPSSSTPSHVQPRCFDIPHYFACGYFAPLARFRHALDAGTSQSSFLVQSASSSVDKPSAKPSRRPPPQRLRHVLFRSLNGELLRVPADCTTVGEARHALTHVLNTYLPFLVLVAMPDGRELHVTDDDVTLASMAASKTITFVSAIVRARSVPLTDAQWVDVLRAHAAVHASDERGVERALHELYMLGGSGLRQRILQEALFVEVNKANSSAEIVRELLHVRACPNAADDSGVPLPNINGTVTEFARAVDAMNVADSVDPTRMDGARPLQYVAWFGHTHVANVLCAARADVNATDGYGASCLHVAVERGDFDCVALFLQQRADVNLQNHLGMSPMHLAVRLERPELVALLVHLGAR